jgi:hypothetical protein
MTQGGFYMTQLVLEIVNVDEDAAEKVARQTIELLSPILKVKSKTLVVEPHDDYRGVWARIDIDLPDDANLSYKTSVVSSTKGIINILLYLNNKANIYVSITGKPNEGEK